MCCSDVDIVNPNALLDDVVQPGMCSSDGLGVDGRFTSDKDSGCMVEEIFLSRVIRKYQIDRKLLFQLRDCGFVVRIYNVDCWLLDASDDGHDLLCAFKIDLLYDNGVESSRLF